MPINLSGAKQGADIVPAIKAVIRLCIIAILCILLGDAPDEFVYAQSQPIQPATTAPPPLSFRCANFATSIERYTNSSICVSGYVYYEGQPVVDAEVVVTDSHGNQGIIRTHFLYDEASEQGYPYFSGTLDHQPFNIRSGDLITIMASYNGITKTEQFRARPGNRQIDIVLPTTQSDVDTLPIATISYINAKDIQPSQAIYVEGRGADADSTDRIVARRWMVGDALLSEAESVWLSPKLFPVGKQILTYSVKDDEGNWSLPVQQILYIRGDESTSLYNLSESNEPEYKTGAFIIVSGGLQPNDPLQSTINKTAQAMFELIHGKGVSEEAIYFLATDNTLKGYDSSATLDNVEYAITHWAIDHVIQSQLLTIYMIGHGERDAFAVDRATNEVLTSTQLDDWLVELQKSVPTLRSHIIIEAPHSGSFIETPRSVSRVNRMVITSSHSDYNLYTFRDGAYFSELLMMKLMQEFDWAESFNMTANVMKILSPSQTPWIDADGYGVPNEAQDMMIASKYSFIFPSEISDIVPTAPEPTPTPKPPTETPEFNFDGPVYHLPQDFVTSDYEDQNHIIKIPIVYNSNGHDVSSSTFGLKFDNEILSYSVESRVPFTLPSSFFGRETLSRNISNQLDVVIMSTFADSLTDGVIAEIPFEVHCPTDSNRYIETKITFSEEPLLSFGSPNGVDISGNGVDGTVRIDCYPHGTQPIGRAIIVAGQTSSANSSQEVINKAAKRVYQLFHRNGLAEEDIYFLANDSTLDGYDAPATLTRLQYALTDWATQRVRSEQALTLYLVDTGERESFNLNKEEDETLTPELLDEWLTGLEEQISDLKINIVIESCQSGSFIDLPHSISKPNRVVITSAHADYGPCTALENTTFTEVFVQKLDENMSIADSFIEAGSKIEHEFPLQQPWIDADGDSIVNEPNDYALAAERGFDYPGTLGGSTNEQVQWTHFIYAMGDNDLHPYLSDNDSDGLLARLQQLKDQAQPGVQLVVLHDGHNVGDSAYYTLSPSGQWQEYPMDELRTDDSQTLADFLQWGLERYDNSEYYALSILGHASGVMGLGPDDSTDLDAQKARLTPHEIRIALQSTQQLGYQHLHIVHFDGCS
ncbi:MAG: C13 family peptidase, partial [Chloroflexota bacterium]